MAKVTIYSSMFCSYCVRAKQLLTKKRVEFEEIDVVSEPDRRKEMIDRAGGAKTTPQIFVGETHVGGCDELYALEQVGGLDPLLAA
jgi:glutaredoxin 3